VETWTRKILVTMALLFCAGAASSTEPPDHPLIGRYEGSTAIHQEASQFTEYTLGLRAVRDGEVAETLKVKGKVVMTLYRGPENGSAFEVISAYRELLRSKGFEVLYSCEKSECGEKFLGAFYGLAPFANDPGWDNSAPITQGNGDFSHVLVAKSGGGSPQAYVSLIVSQGWWTYPVYKLDVVEVQDQAGRISSIGGSGQEPGAGTPEGRAAGPVERRPVQLGVQMASDGYVGLAVCSNRVEVCAKVRAVFYDGFPMDDWPDNAMLVVGGHASYLFRPSNVTDVSVGMDIRQGITMIPHPIDEVDYRQYMDAGLRIGFNHHLGERFMLSGAIYPFWVVVRETDVADSYNLTVTTPTAAVAVSVFF
jgi:hypothetical protein